MNARAAEYTRSTGETEVTVRIDLDGDGPLLGELGGVGEEVEQNLAHPHRVGCEVEGGRSRRDARSMHSRIQIDQYANFFGFGRHLIRKLLEDCRLGP